MTKKTVFLDANILYSWNLNHLIMFFCDTGIGLLEPYWSEHVVGEAVKNICSDNLKEKYENVRARFDNMNVQYPYALVEGYENLEDVDGVHHKDQLVAKAAIYNDCDYLITNNLKHFKKAVNLKAKPKALTADSMLTAIAKKYSKEAFSGTVLAWWHRRDSKTFPFEDYLSFLKRKEKGLGLHHFICEIENFISSTGKVIADLVSDVTAKETKRY